MNIPTELVILFTSMIPISEMGASIPLAKAMGLSAEAGFFWSLIGNTIVSIILLTSLPLILKIIFKISPKFHDWFQKHLKKIHHRHSEKFNQIGLSLITLLIILPIPGTGTYTMSLLAFLLELPFKASLISILIGNIILGLLISGLVQGISTLL